MKFKSKKQKERYLNTVFKSCYSMEQALDNFIYLASKRSKPRTTENHIKECYTNGKLGSLLRRLDPIAFECAD